jgi:hypothetical protein
MRLSWFGGLRYGYGSDTTRTVCVGEPTSEIREVHEMGVVMGGLLCGHARHHGEVRITQPG